MKHITDKEYSKLGMKTALQWAKEKKLPNEDAEGTRLWCSYFHQRSAIYYLPEEVHSASKEELDIFLKPYREKRREQRKEYKEKQDRLLKEELEKRYQQGVEITTQFFEKQINQMKMACKSSVYSAISKNIIPEKLPKIKEIAFDVETTGLYSDMDEILQISIIDGEGNILLDSYVKPYYTIEWAEAERINGISKEMVENAPYPHELMSLVQSIFTSADTWIAYNHNFDLDFLEYWGVKKRDGIEIVDVMFEFAPIYGEYNEYYENFKWQKLTTCAEYFDYEFKAHNSLEDAKATLHCYQRIRHMQHMKQENN